MTPTLDALSATLGQALAARGWMLATAESCTGGWIAEAVTATAGSSGWFDRGFVTYSNEAKVDMLGVSPATLAAHGAVSEWTVCEMASGALARSRAQVAVAVSGVAGPAGGSADKPVGMVCLAWARHDCAPHAVTMRFPGDREAVRRQAVEHALRELIRLAA
ncbi:MAG: nicotinamide-nucleotide amidohydrolase family protein [Betaproteobacteria bacterium]|nr:MAG: nicotinamide-nucleotide amidohydrolase family protein [Betaproteobacteria bacterium]